MGIAVDSFPEGSAREMRRWKSVSGDERDGRRRERWVVKRGLVKGWTSPLACPEFPFVSCFPRRVPRPEVPREGGISDSGVPTSMDRPPMIS
jgi:hypothetical protein